MHSFKNTGLAQIFIEVINESFKKGLAQIFFEAINESFKKKCLF